MNKHPSNIPSPSDTPVLGVIQGGESSRKGISNVFNHIPTEPKSLVKTGNVPPSFAFLEAENSDGVPPAFAVHTTVATDQDTKLDVYDTHGDDGAEGIEDGEQVDQVLDNEESYEATPEESELSHHTLTAVGKKLVEQRCAELTQMIIPSDFDQAEEVAQTELKGREERSDSDTPDLEAEQEAYDLAMETIEVQSDEEFNAELEADLDF